MQQSYRRAAQWYLKANSSHLARLLRKHPLECAPLGEWEPRWHALVPPQIRHAMRATMLVCKRMRMSHGVAMLVVPYVCTE